MKVPKLRQTGKQVKRAQARGAEFPFGRYRRKKRGMTGDITFPPREERPAVTTSSQTAGTRIYFSVARCAARRDFLRLAVARWMTPDFAPLSKAELTSRYACIASSFLPPL